MIDSQPNTGGILLTLKKRVNNPQYRYAAWGGYALVSHRETFPDTPPLKRIQNRAQMLGTKHL